jgi:Family of unknown function (DUF5675)
MIKIKLFRFPQNKFKTGTFGFYIFNGVLYFTVEDLWKDNAVGVSCIPAGVYECKIVKSGTSHAAGLDFAYGLHVDGRTIVRFAHVANVPGDVQGCIGIGLHLNTVYEKVAYSVGAVQKFYSETNGEEIELEIVQL